MPAPYRRFVHQQHPHGPGTTTRRYPLGMGSHQPHDPMPTHPMMAGRRPNRHPPGVSHQPLREPPSQPRPEQVMFLEVTFLTVVAPEPAATPHQGRAAAAHLQVTDPLRSTVPHLGAAEPTVRTPRPLPGRLHPHLQPINRVNRHLQHADTLQMQPHRHKIRHRGPSWDSANLVFTDSSGASPLFQGFHPPKPTFSRRAAKSCTYPAGFVQVPVSRCAWSGSLGEEGHSGDRPIPAATNHKAMPRWCR